MTWKMINHPKVKAYVIEKLDKIISLTLKILNYEISNIQKRLFVGSRL